jgi:hypothetical protein
MATDFHLGKYLTKLIETKRLRRKEITQHMGVQYSAFYGYESRNSLQFYIVTSLCHAMKYNIFMDFANKLPSSYDYDKSISTSKDSVIEQLKEENKKLKWENDLLKEMMIKKG